MAKKDKRKKLTGNEDAQGFGHNPFAAALGLDAPEPQDKPDSPAQDEAFDWSTVNKVVLRRERKGRGGKTVTLVQGIEDVPSQALDDLKAKIKKSLSVGVSAEPGQLVVQGDQGSRLKPIIEDLGVRNVVQSG